MTIVACSWKCGGAVNTAISSCCSICGRDITRTYKPVEPDTEPRFDYSDPDRCALRTGFMGVADGAPHDTWGCHKIQGHATGRGGKHCSTHLDCGVYLGDAKGFCGKPPGHDEGVHECVHSENSKP